MVTGKKASLVLNDGRIKLLYPDRSIDFNVMFCRTMKIPLNGAVYELPESYGYFPLTHIEDHVGRVPNEWIKRGGVLMPMYQSEALLLRFSSWYPVAIKVAVGKINALSGEPWRNELVDEPQDYFVCPQQRSLAGFYIAKNIERQFIATALGDGYSPEEQVSNKAEYGGIQIIVYPLKKEIIQKINANKAREKAIRDRQPVQAICMMPRLPAMTLSLALGGKIHQEIYEDSYGIGAWDTENASRCFVQIVNSQHYKGITGCPPPHWPLSKRSYAKENIPPPFQSESKISLIGSKILSGLKTILP